MMSIQTLAYLSSVVGLVIIWMLYERVGYRPISISVPLLAPYVYLRIEILYAIIVGILVSALLGEIFYRYLLFYGLRQFFIYNIISMLVIFITLYTSINEEVLLLSTLPGLFAYDVHSSRNRVRTAILSAIFFTLHVTSLFILVNILRVV